MPSAHRSPWRQHLVAGLSLPAALGLLLGPPLVGCVRRVPIVGLVEAGERGAVLLEADGRRTRLARGGEGAVVAALQGCEVEIDGARLFSRLRVEDWRIRSAPGGGQPFVGTLRLFGSNWLIDDRSTGRPVILDLREHPELAEHQGELVLVIGYVAGAQTVRPMQWRVIAPEEAGGRGAAPSAGSR